MRIDINIEEFIKENECMEVTSTYIFDGESTVLNENGIFSPTIFGRVGSPDREHRRGYVDLKGKYLHPMIYNALSRAFQVIPSVVSGEAYIKLTPEGYIVKADANEQGAFTGLAELYNHWNRINFNNPNGNTSSRNNLVLLTKELKRDECFVDKWLLIAAYYRDINTHAIASSGGGRRIELEEINTYYIKLIGYANSESVTYANAYYTQSNIQNTLMEIYELLTSGKLAKKSGITHAAVMGKTVDRSVITVISAPRFVSDNYEEQQVPYGHIQIPLHIIINLFYPFVINYLSDMFADSMGVDKILLKGKLLDTNEQIDEILSTEAIEKMVLSFIKDRTKTVRLAEFSIGGKSGLGNFESRFGRKITVTDLMFHVAADLINNRHILATRFPLSGSESQIICKIKIGTTERTLDKSLGTGSDYDNHFKRYPDVREGVNWIDSTVPNNSYLAGLGGDFDGDTVRLIGMYTNEANEMAKKIMQSPTNYVGLDEKFMRGITREAGLGIYALTK